MNQLKVFENNQFGEIRTLEIDGEPFFVGRDVAQALGYAEPHKAVNRHVEDEDGMNHPIPSASGLQETRLINEAGLYCLILSSKLPDARKFKRWVTGEVLPAIRKDGGYLAASPDETPEQILARAVIVAQETINRQHQKVKALETQTAQQTQIIAELQPKASYYDLILHSKELQPITKIAKDYGLSGTALNRILCELGIQYRMGETWLLYQKFAGQGYTQSKTHIVDAEKSVMHTYWTQKGRLFIYDVLRAKKGILPTIEQELSA